MALTQKQFCVFFGPIVRTVSMVSEYENGVSAPPLGLFVLLGRKGVNLQWLFTGEGEMHEVAGTTSYAPKEKQYVEKLVEILRHKDEGTISAITQNIDTFLKVPDKVGGLQKKRKTGNAG